MNKSYYAIIPANVRYDESLCANAKLLYGEITALCNEKGFCWATNEYFAELYKVSTRSISKWIGQLAHNKYIKIELIYREKSKHVLNRNLYLVDSTYGRKVPHPMEEKFHTYGRKVPPPMEEKFQDNNTYINNTYNNTINKEPDLQFPFNSKDFMFAWNTLIKEPKWKKKTNTALQSTLIKISKFSEKEAIEAINDTISGNYQGVFPKQQKTNFQNGIPKTERTNPFFDELRAKYINQESAEQG